MLRIKKEKEGGEERMKKKNTCSGENRDTTRIRKQLENSN